MTITPVLRPVLKGQLCTGCGLCAGVSDGAIAMGIDPSGYVRPQQTAPLAEAAERKVAAACPGVSVAPWAAPGDQDIYWGPYRAVLTGHSTDPALRQGASSGGAISALAIHALEAGLADAVVQTGAHPDDPRRTITQISETADAVRALIGSRYSPSSPLDGIGALLDDPRRFVFIGKPCDVSALRQLGTVDPRVADRFPVMLSFFCAGIPSLRGTDRILEDLGVTRADLASFRYRGDGWPGYATATRHDGSSAKMSYEDSWGRLLSPVVQFRCKICPDAVGGSADIACADAWYGDDRGYPLFEEQDGRSLILPRTEVGAALLDAAVKAGRVETAPLPLRDIDKMQQSQARRKRLIVSRVAALIVTFQPRFRMTGLRVGDAAREERPRAHLKNFLGMIRRILQGRKHA